MEVLKWILGVAVASFIAGFGTLKFIESKIDERIVFGIGSSGSIGKEFTPKISELQTGLSSTNQNIAALQNKVRSNKDIGELFDTKSKGLASKEDVLKTAQEVISAESINLSTPVGTIVSSVLPPEKLYTITTLWVPADGRSIDQNTKYAQLTNKSNVPDLRGLFVRGLNAFERDGFRSDGFADPEVNRVVGSVQKAETQSHTHNVPKAMGGFKNTGFDMFGAGKGGVENPKFGTVSDPHGGAETRPNNIALYYYIRIN